MAVGQEMHQMLLIFELLHIFIISYRDRLQKINVLCIIMETKDLILSIVPELSCVKPAIFLIYIEIISILKNKHNHCNLNLNI